MCARSLGAKSHLDFFERQGNSSRNSREVQLRKAPLDPLANG
jgi:hypothetical protein